MSALRLMWATLLTTARGADDGMEVDGVTQCTNPGAEQGPWGAAENGSCALSARGKDEQTPWIVKAGSFSAAIIRHKLGLTWGNVSWGNTEVCTDTLRLGALFAVRGMTGKIVSSKNCRLIDEPIQSNSNQFSAVFNCTTKGLHVEWSARLYSLNGSLGEALRITVNLRGIPVQSLAVLLVPQGRCLELAATGSVDGSPARAGKGRFFLAAEHPLAKSHFSRSDGQGLATMWGRYAFVAEVGHLGAINQAQLSNTSGSLSYGAVVLAVAEHRSQGRRAFAEYLRTIQPRNAWQGPLVHYNSWYDFYQPLDGLGFSRGHVPADHHDMLLKDKMNEKNCLKVVAGFRQLTRRGIKLDSFLWDDGWDDPRQLWEFDQKRFPSGFSKVAEKAKQYLGAGLGVWLSPWGGYGETKDMRLKLGRKQGYETNKGGFSLAGPKYAARFAAAVQRFRQESRVNMFKFDGVAGDPSELSAEVEAMLSIISSIRSENCKDDAAHDRNDTNCDPIWINLTTGTWPSPFFILWADSIWRGGADIEKEKSTMLEGLSERQRWQVYRECMVYENIVKRADLFPLSRLMIHGVVLANHGDAMYMGLNRLTPADSVDWAQEVWSHAAMGVQLQELYVSHQLLQNWSWNELSLALKWSRKYSQVLEDAHWAIPADCSESRPDHDVDCGGHRAANCAACPQGHGSEWCHGHCRWDARQSKCIREQRSNVFRPYGIASWRSEPSGKNGEGFVFLRNPMSKKQRTSPFTLSQVLELSKAAAAQPLALSIVRRLAAAVKQKSALSCKNLGANSTALDKGACKVAAKATVQLPMLPGEVLVLRVRSLSNDEAAVDKSAWEPAIPVH